MVDYKDQPEAPKSAATKPSQSPPVIVGAPAPSWPGNDLHLLQAKIDRLYLIGFDYFPVLIGRDPLTGLTDHLEGFLVQRVFYRSGDIRIEDFAFLIHDERNSYFTFDLTLDGPVWIFNMLV